MMEALISLAMIAAFALIGTGLWLLVKGVGSKFKAGLMIAAGVVTIFNVWVNTLPPPPPSPAGAAR